METEGKGARRGGQLSSRWGHGEGLGEASSPCPRGNAREAAQTPAIQGDPKGAVGRGMGAGRKGRHESLPGPREGMTHSSLPLEGAPRGILGSIIMRKACRAVKGAGWRVP